MQAEFIFDSPPFKSCHAATLAETPQGLVAAWFGGSRESAPDVTIWLSRQEAGGWSEPVSIADGLDNGERYPCWNPVLYQEPDGLLFLFYKVGPSPRNWWGMVKFSKDHALTWSPPQRLPDGILGPIKNKPVRLPDGLLLCPSSTEQDGWRVHVELTNDLGQHWERVEIPGDLDAIQPTILQLPQGRLQLLCRSTCGWILSSRSNDHGYTWSELKQTRLPNPKSGIDAVTLADGRHVLVYNHAGMILGRWGGPRTPLNLAHSLDGEKWVPGPVLETESGEYSYPAILQAADETIHVLYTWQRKNIRHVWLKPEELER